MTTDTTEVACAAEADRITEVEEQLAYMQTVIAVLVRRCGGATVICEAELASVAGHGIRLTHALDAGVELHVTHARMTADDEDLLAEDSGINTQAGAVQYLH